MGKIISFFNHKGGVGKTTLVHNLAFALSDLGKSVLLIDADPQMNLTAAIFGLNTSVEYSTDAASKWSQLTKKHKSILEFLNEKLKNESCNKELFQVSKLAETQKKPVTLIRGDINIPNMEAELFNILKSNNSFNRNIISNFESTISDLAQEYDFVLIDTSPSSSSIINALMILCSDYFIAPTSPSFFSTQAIDNLQTVFENWFSLIGSFHAAIGLQGLSFKVKFLGIVVQMAKRYKSSGSSAATRWIAEVNTSIGRFTSWANTGKKFAISDAEFQKIFTNYGAHNYKSQPFIIEKCCDFTPTLKSAAEHFGVPVIYLTQDLCDRYKKEHNERAEEYNKTLEIGETGIKKLTVAPNISNKTRKDQQYVISFDSISTSYRKIAADLLNL